MEVSGTAGTRLIEAVRPASNRTTAGTDISRAANSADAPAQGDNAPLSPAVLAQLADKARSVLRPVNLDIQFSFDKNSGTTIIRIMDMETAEVIRQIPSEEMMELSRALEKMQGALLQNRV